MIEKKIVTILGFAGSLRKGSFNKMLLREASRMLPPNTKLETFDLEGIPPFNQDLEMQPPEIVKEFKSGIRMADALLIVTPEYNYSIPGVLKNAIDWASRPPQDNVFRGKPVSMMGASIGMAGTVRAQSHLRQCFVFLDMYPINKPEVLISFAPTKFDENGTLKDDHSRKLVRENLEALVAWILRIKR